MKEDMVLPALDTLRLLLLQANAVGRCSTTRHRKNCVGCNRDAAIMSLMDFGPVLADWVIRVIPVLSDAELFHEKAQSLGQRAFLILSEFDEVAT